MQSVVPNVLFLLTIVVNDLVGKHIDALSLQYTVGNTVLILQSYYKGASLLFLVLSKVLLGILYNKSFS